MTVEKPVVARGVRKGGKSSRDKAIAQAKAKQLRDKATSNAALLVLFGQPPANALAPASKPVTAPRASNSLLRADAATRRYDGNDWRISSYQPL